MLLLTFPWALSACGKNDSIPPIVFTTQLKDNEIFRIGARSCTLPEIMVYLTTTQNQYERVYGYEIWEVSVNGRSLEDSIKENVLAKIAQIKTMYLLAMEREVVLSEEEIARVEAAAEDYFQTLNETEISAMKISIDIIQNLYTEYAYADKVYQQIIGSLNPEISDDEARIITVQQIYLQGKTTENLTQAQEVRELAQSGEEFEALALSYSDEEVITDSFGKGERESAVEAAAFAMETAQISQVVEGENGYYILKCISTLNREETDVNKQKIVEQRKEEVFGQDYDAYVKGLVRILNEEAWEKVTFLHDEDITTADFFDCYTKYFTVS
jgi:foldase protein PrsA